VSDTVLMISLNLPHSLRIKKNSYFHFLDVDMKRGEFKLAMEPELEFRRFGARVGNHTSSHHPPLLSVMAQTPKFLYPAACCQRVISSALPSDLAVVQLISSY
jgi:hypothetical protein